MGSKPWAEGFRNGTTYEVLIGGKRYPPKAIASYAYELAGNKDILYPRDFAGAWEGKWHKRLEEAGFKPERKSGRAASTAATRVRRQTTIEDLGDNVDEEEFSEGAQHYSEHIRRERDPNAVSSAKARRWREKQAFACDACGFDFAKAYGERGSSYIEAHHTIPVHKMKPGHKTKIADLALVCSNCHRMLHRKPLINVPQLKEALRARADKA